MNCHYLLSQPTEMEKTVFFSNSNIAVKVLSFINSETFEGNVVVGKEEFYNKPTSLHKLHNIFKGSFSTQISILNVASISSTLLYFPIDDKQLYFTPLIHTT